MAHQNEDPKNFLIVLVGVGCFVTLVGVMFGLGSYYDRLRDDEQQSKVLGKPNADLVTLRAEEARKMTTYAVLDKSKGRYRIPVDRAIDLLSKKGRDAFPVLQPDPANAWVNGAPPAAASSAAAPPEPPKDDKDKKDKDKKDKDKKDKKDKK